MPSTLEENKVASTAFATQKTCLNLPGLMRTYRPQFADWTSMAKASLTGLNSRGIGDGKAVLKQASIGGKDAVQMTVTSDDPGKQANGFAHADFAATMGAKSGTITASNKPLELLVIFDGVSTVNVSADAGPGRSITAIQMYLDGHDVLPENDRKGSKFAKFTPPVGNNRVVVKAWSGNDYVQTAPFMVPIDVPVLTDITASAAEGAFWYDDDLQAFEVGGAHYMNGWNAIANVQFGKEGLQLWNDYQTSWVPQKPCTLLKGKWNTFGIHTEFGKNSGIIRQVWLNREPLIFDGSFSFLYTPGEMPGREKLIAEKISYQWQRDFAGSLAVANMEYRIYGKGGAL